MSTIPPFSQDSSATSFEVQAAANAPPPQPATGGQVDPQLIQETKQQIRALVQEITRLAQSDVPLADFHDQFLSHLVSALASVGGAVWSPNDDGALELQYQINLTSVGILEPAEKREQHGVLLRRVIEHGKPVLVPPQSGPAGEESGNPTDLLLILACVHLDNELVALVEIFQRPDTGPTTQRGYLRFLTQMCDLAAGYFAGRRLRLFQQRQFIWERLEQFLATVHSSLDVTETAYAIANEGARLVAADRISIAIRQGRGCRLEAVSGVESIERRAEDTRCLERIAALVIATDEPLWFEGSTSALAPQLEQDVQAYVDRSQTKLLGVVPLKQSAVEEGQEDRRGAGQANNKPLGALIVEQWQFNDETDQIQQRAEVLAKHGAPALNNALAHSGIFLLPLWKRLGQWRSSLLGNNFWQTIAVLVCLAALGAALCNVQHEFSVPARGKLVPAGRRSIFAQTLGRVVEVNVAHGDPVKPNQLLARMENDELRERMSDLINQRVSVKRRVTSLERKQIQGGRLSIQEQEQLSAQLAAARQEALNVEHQIHIAKMQEGLLEIRAPSAGQVVTWDVFEKLQFRPVHRGQVLMEIADVNGSWELVLHVEERYVGKLNVAEKEDLTVTFSLTSHPESSFVGQIREIESSAHDHPEYGKSVAIRVAINKDTLPELRNETGILARVNCGQRSIGYVWFYELIETVQSKVLFWI